MVKSLFRRKRNQKPAPEIAVASNESAVDVPTPSGLLDTNMMFRFTHPNGSKADEKIFDPWEIDRRLIKHGGENWGEPISIMQTVSESIPQAANFPSLLAHAQAQKQKAFKDLAALSRNVFELPTVAEAGDKGWTDGMAFVLLSDYLIQIAAVGVEFLPLPKSLARPAV